jgi:hypothetical protein
VPATPKSQQQQQQQQPAPLPALEQQLTDLIGPPHNYVGFPQPVLAAESAAADELNAAAGNRASIHAEGSRLVAASAVPTNALGLQFPPTLGGKGAAAPCSSWLGPGLEKLTAAAEVRASQ